jgi:hypothetical protein
VWDATKFPIATSAAVGRPVINAISVCSSSAVTTTSGLYGGFGMGQKIANRCRFLYLQLFQPHRQLTDTLAGGMEDGVADRSVGTDIAEFAETLDAGRINLVVLLGE